MPVNRLNYAFVVCAKSATAREPTITIPAVSGSKGKFGGQRLHQHSRVRLCTGYSQGAFAEHFGARGEHVYKITSFKNILQEGVAKGELQRLAIVSGGEEGEEVVDDHHLIHTSLGRYVSGICHMLHRFPLDYAPTCKMQVEIPGSWVRCDHNHLC